VLVVLPVIPAVSRGVVVVIGGISATRIVLFLIIRHSFTRFYKLAGHKRLKSVYYEFVTFTTTVFQGCPA